MMRGETRGRIVAAAMALFRRKGYGSTSIADICEASGVNAGSLYHFFPAKQDLLLAVLDAYRDGIGPMLLEPAWKGESDPIERVFRLLGAYREALVASECRYGCPIGSLALELHDADPAVRKALAENFQAWTDAVKGCFAAAPEGFLPDVDLTGLAELTLSVMEGGVMQARTHGDIARFDRGVAQLRRYISSLRGQKRGGRR